MRFKKNDMRMKTSACYVYTSNNPTKKPPHNRRATKRYYKGAINIEPLVLGPQTRDSRCVTAECGQAHPPPRERGFSQHTDRIYFRTPRSAPLFTTQPRVQPDTERMQWGQRGDQAIENARYTTPRHGLEEHL
jgi:hypothetical protein